MTELPPHLSSANERQWLYRYLSGDLDASELEEFEAYALTRPHLLDSIEDDDALRCLMPLARDLRPRETMTV